MRSKTLLSDEEFFAKIDRLSKPMAKANLDHMYVVISDARIGEIVKKARVALGIPKKGLKPNNRKAYYEEMRNHQEGGSILLYTTTMDQRKILYGYVDLLISKFDIYEHFREALAIYVVHNLVFAPGHNVSIKCKLRFDRSVLPELRFFRMPYVNDWKIAKLLIERHRFILSRFMTGLRPLPEKFKKSYRGKVDLRRDLDILNETVDRSRKSELEEINVTNSELADLYFNDKNKTEAVKKLLNRSRKRIKEITSN